MSKIIGYTSMMSAESMNLPYLEALKTWSYTCDKIAICYSTFPDLGIKAPKGAVAPWEEDKTIDILQKFDDQVLDDKLVLCKHEWRPDFPREDGFTKQLARNLAMELAGPNDWLAHFDADECLPEKHAAKLMEIVQTQEQSGVDKVPYISTGILEMFGGHDKVRLDFGSWIKLRMTRRIPDIVHDMPLWARTRHPETGQIIALENRDDGAGMMFNRSMNRPDLNTGHVLCNLRPLGIVREIIQQRINEGDETLYQKDYADAMNGFLQDLEQGLYIFHAGWIDIARKWRMGWFWDNAWSVLNGNQKTFTEKVKESGTFTMTRQPKNLKKELAREMDRPSIIPIKNEYPTAYGQIKKWRKENEL